MFTALAVAGTAILAPLRSAEAENGPPITTFALANGLNVVVIADTRTPVVTHMIWYRVGSADEVQGKSGLAHFLEHLMFKGTAKNPEGKFSKTLATLGGQQNAFTSTDFTAYFARVTRDHLEKVMEFEADRMTGLVLTDAVVLPERDVVLEERRTRIDNDPAAQLGEAIQAALFVNHPYGRPVIGWEHEIRALNREEALAFYRRFYAPNNAILVIAGNVLPDEARTLAEKSYGQVSSSTNIGTRVRPQEPEPRANRRIVMANPRVAQPSLTRSYLMPSYRTAKPGEAEAIDVLVHVLGSGTLSRLNRALVMEQGIAASAGAWYASTTYDMSRMTIYATPRPGVTLDDLEVGVNSVIADIIANGITESDLARAKTKLVAETIYAWDDQFTLARMYGAALATGMTVESVQTWPDRIRAVTKDQVQVAAETWLESRRSVTGYLVKPPVLPEKAALPEKRS